MSTNEVFMDYDEVNTLAGEVGKAEDALSEGWDAVDQAPNTNSVYGTHQVADFNAFGNTPAAAGLASRYRDVVGSGATATGNLGMVLGDDVARLGEVIRCFQEHDHEAADRLCAVAGGNTLSVYATHVHSGGGEAVLDPHPDDVWPPPDPHDPIRERDSSRPTTRDDPSTIVDDQTANDYVRAGQIDRFEDIFNENPGVVGADLNVEADDGSRAADAVLSFEDQGNTIDGGRLDDGLGGTHRDRHIDYVVTAPGVTPANPQRVEGGSSDHDGQRVDLTVARW